MVAKIVDRYGWRKDYRMFAAKINGVGYVFVTFRRLLDFRSGLHYWSDVHAQIKKGVEEHLADVSKVVFCGSDDGIKEKAGVNVAFMSDAKETGERDTGEAAVRSIFQMEVLPLIDQLSIDE